MELASPAAAGLKVGLVLHIQDHGEMDVYAG